MPHPGGEHPPTLVLPICDCVVKARSGQPCSDRNVPCGISSDPIHVENAFNSLGATHVFHIALTGGAYWYAPLSGHVFVCPNHQESTALQIYKIRWLTVDRCVFPPLRVLRVIERDYPKSVSVSIRRCREMKLYLPISGIKPVAVDWYAHMAESVNSTARDI